MNKIKNIFTALYVLCVSGLKRIFIIKSKRPYCVIVFHTGKLGDMVCATPIFRAIKQSYPSSKVIVFGNKVNKDIVKYNDNVDHYEIIQGSIKDNIRNINRYYADYAILLTPGFNSISSLLLSNVRSISVPRIVNGFSPYETKTYRLLSLLTNRVEHRMGNYAPSMHANDRRWGSPSCGGA
jgi:ADP-heptose:LPS heptosyltransferase